MGAGGAQADLSRWLLNWPQRGAWSLWLEGKGEGGGGQVGEGVQPLVTLAEAETAVPISHRSPR